MKTGQISEAEAEYGDHVYPEDKTEECDHRSNADDASQDTAVSSG